MEAYDIAAFLNGMEILEIENIGNRLDVAAKRSPGEAHGIEVALSGVLIGGIVDRVVGDAGARKSVGDAQASEREPLHGITREEREPGAVLIVILNELRIDADGLAKEERLLAGLIETVAAGEERKAGRDGSIEKVRLGEAEHEAALNVAELRGEGESFAKAEEIVGLIGESDEGAGQTADAALQTDGLLALFLELQGEIDRTFFLIALDLDGLVFLDAVEVIELIQAQDADLPGALVEELTFVEKEFAADNFVARGGVADEIDAADVILLFFVEAHGDVNALGGLVDIGLRLRGEIDETILAIRFAVVIQGFANFGRGEDVAFLKGENSLERIDLQRESFIRIGADNFQRAHLVAIALFDGNGDIDGFAVSASSYRDAHAEAGRIDILENRILHDNFEVAIVLVQAADANFEIFVEFFAVVRFGEEGNVPEVEGNGVGAIVSHGADELAIAERVIAGEFNLADLYLGTFVDFENEDDRVAGGDALVLRRDFGKLAAVLAQQFLQDDFRFLDARGVELAFDSEADLALFKTIENVRLGNGMNVVVANAANDRALFDFEDDSLVIGTFGRVFDAQLNIFEELCVPQSLEVAAQRFFIIRITVAAENSRFQRVAADAAIADEKDAIDYGSGGLRRRILERMLGIGLRGGFGRNFCEFR